MAAIRETRQAQAAPGQVRAETGELLKRSDPGASTNDTNYVFLRFVLAHLPAGLIGLVFAAIFVAAIFAEAVVIACFKLTAIGFLWYDLIGCALVLAFALALSVLWPRAGKAAAV